MRKPDPSYSDPSTDEVVWERGPFTVIRRGRGYTLRPDWVVRIRFAGAEDSYKYMGSRRASIELAELMITACKEA